MRWNRVAIASAAALPFIVVLVLAVAAGGGTRAPIVAGVDTTKIPKLAAASLPVIGRSLVKDCPSLPAVWVIAQAQQESRWNPQAWVDDRNGGTAGLLQINQTNWIFLGGDTWGVPTHTRPPDDNGIWETQQHLERGIKLDCQNLDRATKLLATPAGKKLGLDPIQGMLVCHNLGCRVLTSGHLPPAARRYIDGVTRYAITYSAAGSPGGRPGDPGPVPPVPGGTCAVDTLTPRRNPRSCAQAITWAERRVQDRCVWYQRCLGLTAHAYGWAASGEYSAATHWRRMVASGVAHPGDRNPPAGALLFWKGGQYGHVALYLGDGRIASNDIARFGCVDIVPWDAPETRWHQRYLGWAPPYYPDGVGRDTSNLVDNLADAAAH